MALFGPGDAAESARLRLTAAHSADAEAMAWLVGAVAPEWELADLKAHVEGGEATLISNADGKAIGLAVALVGLPEQGDACVPLIAIEPGERFRGLGGEAGLALETWLLEHFAVRRVLAPVPEGRGLAVYFWLRLGYRPMLGAEAPWPLVGLAGKPVRGIWMGRGE